MPAENSPSDGQHSISVHPRDLRISDFGYDLPQERIALYPTEFREQARMLEYRGGSIFDRSFGDLPNGLPEGVHLVLNNTRVVPARLRWPLPNGSILEFLLLEPDPATPGDGEGVTWWCMIGNNRAWKSGTLDLVLPTGNLHLERGQSKDGQWQVHFGWQPNPDAGPESPQTLEELLDLVGEVPLPPYLQRSSESLDRERYQTTYAKERGAVAAPTAGLHLTPLLLEQIKQKGGLTTEVTLHVGAGTFQPVKSENIAEHTMHSEWYDIPESTQLALHACKARGGKVWAVGTTSVRTLESWAKSGLAQGDTQIFITPGFEFQWVDCLITNFHLPKSTLMMLVSAFAGYEHVMALYQHAIAHKYRFFSYGDAMLLKRSTAI
mgnify:CR=1 FL=1